jgi:NitT/TauT family transport system permease protein
VLPPAAVLAALIALWYAASQLLVDPALRFLLPTPDEVVTVAFLDAHNVEELLRGLGLSARVALIGLVLAVAIGLCWAMLMSQARWLERSLYPYAVILQTVPVLALVPLFGYWFGYNLTSRVLVCVLIALFPIVTFPARQPSATCWRSIRWS